MPASPVTTVRVSGAKQLRKAMKAASSDMAALTDVHRDVGNIVLRRASSTAPRDTGKLAASLKSSPTRTKARVTSRLPYAAPVHWGVPARGVEAQPWLSQAAVQTEGRWEDLYRRRIEELISDMESSTTGVV